MRFLRTRLSRDAIIFELRHALTTPTRAVLAEELIDLNLLSCMRDYIVE
ncbi:MAG: hypothetical protein O2983_13120 [Planctomycetota bacterium]|nr:hypothetical protein [Planctomycetota bacterium]MDA1160541.1 hypothetical protein [Planctomycetota bacterium]